MLNINDKLNKMIQDIQEYLEHWEKENNPFYPSEMKWDRLQVNRFLKDYKQQLILPVVVGRSEQLHECSHRKGKKCIKPSSCYAFGCNKPM